MGVSRETVQLMVEVFGRFGMVPGRILRANDVAMWSAGFDWLRVTLNSDTYGQLAGAKAAYTVAAMRAGFDAGYKGEPEVWRFRGYNGRKWGKVSYGENWHSGLIYEATGYAADFAIGQPVPWTGVPRLDIQVTLWLVSDVPDLSQRIADSSDRARKEVNHRPWKVTERLNRDGGNTVYLGERKESPVFIRVYDKMREELGKVNTAEEEASVYENWRNAWRFEVELKEGEGATIYETYRFMKEVQYAVGGMVYEYLRRRGIEMPHMNGGNVYRPLPRVDEMDKQERRLQWLNRYVSPTIDRMLSEGVPLESIVSALELPER